MKRDDKRDDKIRTVEDLKEIFGDGIPVFEMEELSDLTVPSEGIRKLTDFILNGGKNADEAKEGGSTAKDDRDK